MFEQGPSIDAAGETVRTSEIPVGRWRDFFGRVDAAARDLPVSVEMVGPEIGSQTFARDVSLRGICFTERGGPEIEVDLGNRDQTEHRVIRPSRIYAAQTEAGALRWLDLEDDGQQKMLIHFHAGPKVRVH